MYRKLALLLRAKCILCRLMPDDVITGQHIMYRQAFLYLFCEAAV